MKSQEQKEKVKEIREILWSMHITQTDPDLSDAIIALNHYIRSK